MKKVLTFAGWSIICSVAIAITGLYFLVSYLQSLEAKATTAAPYQRPVAQAPDIRFLTVYNPINLHTYTEQSLLLKGETHGTRVIVSHGTEIQTLTPNDRGLFETTINLEAGIQKIGVLALDSEGQIELEDVTIGYFPQNQDPNLKVIIGEVEKITSPSFFSLATGNKTFTIEATVPGLEPLQQVSAAGHETKDSHFTATIAKATTVPYFFYGRLQENNDATWTLERIIPLNQISTITLTPNAPLWSTDSGGPLTAIPNSDLKKEDLVYGAGIVNLKGNRTHYHTTFLVKL